MRLRDPKAGTVVHVGDAQAARYLASGWVDADSAPETETDSPEPRKRGRPRKTDS
jgi:hypothetical protein